MHSKVKNAECKHNNSLVQVYECKVGDIVVLRRRSDSYVNATQILKAAGVDDSKRIRKILESLKETLPGEHEAIPTVVGSSPAYRGTWIPLDRGRELARDHAVGRQLAPLFDLIPDTGSLSIGIDSPSPLSSVSSLSPLSMPLRLSTLSSDPLPEVTQDDYSAPIPSGSDLAPSKLESEEASTSTGQRETSTKRKRDDSDSGVEESPPRRLRHEGPKSFIEIPSALEGILDVTGKSISDAVAKVVSQVFASARETIIPRMEEVIFKECNDLQTATKQVEDLRNEKGKLTSDIAAKDQMIHDLQNRLQAEKQRFETMDIAIQQLSAKLLEEQAKAVDAAELKKRLALYENVMRTASTALGQVSPHFQDR